MKSILILCVNYNSYKELKNYLCSINAAAKSVTKILNVDVLVADNTIENIEEVGVNYIHITVKVYPFYYNFGYMGGVTQMMKKESKEKVLLYDFVIISNVDLKLAETFFVELLKINRCKVGWIAPKIITECTRKDENPHMIDRPTKLKIQLLQFLYECPMLYSFYTLGYKYMHKKRKQISASYEERSIYAGHGSIMIFTKEVVEKYFPFVFPAFLYGEEIYFGELVLKLNLKTVYCPSVNVFNIGNVSTKFLGNKKRCKFSLESILALRREFF